MTDFRKGDTVRVTQEGVVSRPFGPNEAMILETNEGHWTAAVMHQETAIVSLERIADPRLAVVKSVLERWNGTGDLVWGDLAWAIVAEIDAHADAAKEGV